MNESTMTVTIPLSEYNALIRAQFVADTLRQKYKEMTIFEFAGFAEKLLSICDAGEAE